MRIIYLLEERIPQNLRDLVIERIEKANFEYKLMFYTDSIEKQVRLIKWAEAVLCAPGRKIADEVLEAGSHIKLYQLWSSGYDKFDCKKVRSMGIATSNNGGANAVSVAEHTLLLMLATCRQLPAFHARTVSGNWSGNSHGMDLFMLKGKTLGIIGLGNIGSAVAVRALAFGMKVVYSDISAKLPENPLLKSVTRVALEELLQVSDIVTLHLHLNSETEELVGSEELALMKPTSILINVSRAGLIEQEAFKRALLTGRIWGAGLDVYPMEPTVPGDQIVNHHRVVATPHTAGSTIDVYIEAVDRCILNLQRVSQGDTPEHVVN